MMKEKILVVGGTGFIGHNLLKKFSFKKYSLYSISKNKKNLNKKIKGVKYLQCDISSYKIIRKKILINFDHVINLSGYIDHKNKKENLNCHYKGCKNLVKFFKKKKIKTFMQIGSSLEYGDQKSPQLENKKCKPLGYYGYSKFKASKFLINFAKKNDFPYIILRPYQIYGPHQKINRLIPQTIDACLKNKKFNCTQGLQKRDFLYVDDFTNLIKKIIQSEQSRKQIFNVGFGKPYTVKHIIKLIRSKIGSGSPQFGKISMRRDEINSLFPSIKKIKKIFNWKPKIKLSKGIVMTINSYANKK